MSINLIGETIGKLTVLDKKIENKRTYYYCKCECGNNKWIRSDSLRKSLSCGCIRKEKIKQNAPNLIKKHLDKNIIENTNLSKIKTKVSQYNNKSGYKGVHYNKDRNLWVAQIWFKKKHYFLGRYKNKQDAIKARKEAEEKYHESFLEWYYNKKEK